MGSARNLTRDTDLATSLEVAGSLWAKFMGLMGRASLAEGAGLWLPESNGIHMMFMRFPIDALFVGAPDGDGERPPSTPGQPRKDRADGGGNVTSERVPRAASSFGG